jgi:hypothetical protein
MNTMKFPRTGEVCVSKQKSFPKTILMNMNGFIVFKQHHTGTITSIPIDEFCDSNVEQTRKQRVWVLMSADGSTRTLRSKPTFKQKVGCTVKSIAMEIPN